MKPQTIRILITAYNYKIGIKKIFTSHKLALLFLTLTFIACGSANRNSADNGSVVNRNPTNGGSAGGGAPKITELTIANAQAGEGENITFTVATNQSIAKPISFDYKVVFDTPIQIQTSAIASDFTGETSGNKTIATNDSNTTISIGTFNDSLRENSETFLVILSNLTPRADATFTDNVAIGTILANDDATGIVTILVADATAKEDIGNINFQVKSEFPAISPFTFEYEATLDSNSASTDDFTVKKGLATIPAGSSSTIISISLERDTIIEPDETFRFLLTNPSANVMLAKIYAVGTILNDDLGEITRATATTGDSQITLNWANPVSNIFAGVTIAQTTGATAPADCSSGRQLEDVNNVIINSTNDTTYSFRICARSNSSLSSGVGLANFTPLRIVDSNNNGLIGISDATQFYNIRYNLAGTSYKTSDLDVSNSVDCPINGCSGYELIANIDLSSFTNWEPIGSSSNKFTAILEGNGNTISGLRITGNNDYVGLFSAIQNATISNLKLADVSISGKNYVGALAGNATGTTTLSNIELIGDKSQSSSDAEIKGSGSQVGGLVGYFTGAISDASSSLTVRGGGNTAIYSGGLVGFLAAKYVGGLAGFLTAGGSIKNSNSSGSVSNFTEVDRAGGLVGRSKGNISNSWASGNVSVTGNSNFHYGGLVGENTGNISNSWASGNVSSNGNSNLFYGGLTGQNTGNISNSWASGNVFSNGSSNTHFGGLVGQNVGTISNSWASGEITASTLVGGLVGWNAKNINGRNYQIDNDARSGVNLANDAGTGESFVLGRNNNRATKLTALANLSGEASESTSDYGMRAGWHAGFDISDPTDDVIDLETRFCDTNGNGMIDVAEQVATNSVWVMLPTANSVPVPTTNTTGVQQNYYAIPAIRCIGNTKVKTPTEIDAIRKYEIDRQRRQFPRP